MPRRMHLARAFALSTATLTSACGGGGTPAPAPSPPPAVPQIAGTYSGPTTDNATEPAQRPLTWTIRFSVPGDNNLYFKSCDGTLTLVQSGSRFTGTFAQSGGNNCPSISGQVVNGGVQSSGTITFSLAGPASDPLVWTTFNNCTAVTPGTMSFSGTVNGDHIIEATFAQDALMQCPTEGTVSAYVRVRGARQ